MEKTIYLAGGCFWGTEHFFKQIAGVLSTEVGFANGHTDAPTYEQVYTDTTGYAETVRVVYDPSQVTLEFLLQMFFVAIDPTSLNKQGHDEGTRYRTGIYYTDADDRPVIDKVFAEEQSRYGEPLVVEREPLRAFYPADEYHQDYLDKHPDGYCHLPQALFAFARQARKRIEVVAAVIFDADDRIFATQRGYGEWKDWWEFPGGKIEAGESREEALRREIQEELDAEIEVGELMKTIDYDYPNFHLTMHCYKCRLSVTGYRLREHEAARWLAPNELNSVKWLPADEDFIKELNANTIRIVFEEAEQQSAAYDGDKLIGECQYNIDRTGKWVIMHTGVRPEYNGRGIAKRLVEYIIKAARERGAKIIPVCSYAQRMMSGKDEYKDVLI